MPDSTTHGANLHLSIMQGNSYSNVTVSGGPAQLGNTYITRGERDASSALDILEPHINKNASYNSSEREQEGASICQPGTREQILTKIQRWTAEEGPPVLWLYGPAGAGKSTIAQTIAEQCDKKDKKNLAFSYFFSRRNANRSDLTKFIPTFAYQLVRTVPSLDTSVREAVRSDPSIFAQSLEAQARALIVEPLKAVTEQVPSMVVVIDGLDEYSEDDGKYRLENLILILIEALTVMPFRIFFASRLELYIAAIFKRRRNVEITEIPVRDWETMHDVSDYLKTELSRVREDKEIGMSPWPSKDDLKTLVEKTEGIFIYASTLVKFVGARNCNSIKRLQEALKSHNGLDSLFQQVLDSAKEHEDFQFVIGIIMFLRESLPLGELARFLGWNPYDLRSALEGSLSILFIPKGDDVQIHPYHASLQDFFRNSDRSGYHFLDSATNHRALFNTSAKLILKDTDFFTKPGLGISYAYYNWCYHLCSLINDNTTSVDRTTVEALIQGLGQDWIARLARWKSHDRVASWLVELEGVIVCAKRHSSINTVSDCMLAFWGAPDSPPSAFSMKSINSNTKVKSATTSRYPLSLVFVIIRLTAAHAEPGLVQASAGIGVASSARPACFNVGDGPGDSMKGSTLVLSSSGVISIVELPVPRALSRGYMAVKDKRLSTYIEVGFDEEDEEQYEKLGIADTAKL
ncbi:hypothetical protein M422DRAFT_778568 [Sphaerobolus stellatus SS14]|uniref:NACHT domain-containing protein n=1 Tax=Sphaerobolus stellatus (strain SS14) TaxID=990650 RepID=A0A0C9VTS7_SPHS4|nr:hypothetical protein M422DRAFT_778568 [Sphaerobolus stellatus SS14]